jgi:carboxypeptidase Taq
MTSAYQQLVDHFQQLYRLDHLAAICHWDQATMMPAGSNEARSEAMAELALIHHRRLTAPEVGDWLDAAAPDSLDSGQRANVREMRRIWRQATVLPEDLVRAKSLAGARCEHAWREQRKQNDWSGFAVNLREVVKLSREEASVRAQANGGSRYDSLLDLYEPGMTAARLDTLFGDLAGWLPELSREIVARQSAESCTRPTGPFPVESQRALGLRVMALLGFDFRRGRLDISTHPFCGGVPEDVRITTRYTDADFSSGLMGVIHETGHGCYEQNLPIAWRGQPAGQARSMGVHESQSLLFEMQLGRHPAFLHWLSPLLAERFGDAVLPLLEAGNLEKLYTRVEPGLIRVDADEVTYPCHIMLRYEIERALIEGDIEVNHIPELWDQKMKAGLGLSTAGDYRNGCMQDIHWTDGGFGYFPTYTLGALYAAQLFAALSRDLGGLEMLLREGDLRPLSDWLRQRVWCQGRLLETSELMRATTGEELNPVWFRRHLEQRYLSR